MDYIAFLVDKNKNKTELELVEWYMETCAMKQASLGEAILGDIMQTAILWILKIKPKSYAIKYYKLKRVLINEQK